MARTDKNQQEATISCEALQPFSAAYIRLSAIAGVNDGEVAKAMAKSKIKGISKKTLNNIRERRHPPKLLTLEAVAKWFKVPLWVMFIDDLPDEFLQNPMKDRFVKMVEDYICSDSDGRIHAENAAALGCYTAKKKKA